MFGRRRRAARAAQAHEQELQALEIRARELDASARAAAVAERTEQAEQAEPTIRLTADAVTALLRHQLGELIGTDGVWTLVPRRTDDTEVFFHDLKAAEIARTLSRALQAATDPNAETPAGTETRSGRARPSATADASAIILPAAHPVSTSTLTTPITEPTEPTALPWTPRPVTHWAEPESATAPTPAPNTTHDAAARQR